MQLVVFDLDFCIWQPEMYQIQGPPILKNLQSIQPKLKRKRRNDTQQLKFKLPKNPNSNQKGMIVTDRNGTPITVFDGASYALSEINRWRQQKDDTDSAKSNIRVAVASCTNEPSYARKCMDWLVVDDGSTLASCFDCIEIRPGDKRKHFESLQRITGIPYEDMCFFDDYDLNINNVRTLGVKCFHTPFGMTRDIWEDALDTFDLN